jgi:hypothetical protein
MQSPRIQHASSGESTRGAKGPNILTGSRWQFLAASVLLAVWTMFLIVMAIFG